LFNTLHWFFFILQKAKEEEENTSPSQCKKDKRSGWPEHVWASELKTTEWPPVLDVTWWSCHGL